MQFLETLICSNGKINRLKRRERSLSAIITGRSANLLIVVVVAVLSVYLIFRSRKHPFTLRRLPALDAIEEMVGRCTEQGKPLVSCGVWGLQTASIAAMSIHGYAAEMCATRKVKDIYVVFDPATMGMMRDMFRIEYLKGGVPELFDPIDDIRYYGSQPESKFASGVAAVVDEVRPGGLLAIGFGETTSGAAPMQIAMCAEIAARQGAMRVGGSSLMSSVMALAVTCDYVIIGEEVLACGAYASKDPTMLGSVVTQDVFRMILTGLLILGLILSIAGIKTLGQIMVT